ncbi:hypothetical protein IT157_04110 [bacterium]|nr:hypothetical protein [bacterium]
MHLRQDREIHDNYFRLREQMWYGFAEASITRGPWSGSAKLEYEHAEMDFPGVVGTESRRPGIQMSGSLKSLLGTTTATVSAGNATESGSGAFKLDGIADGKLNLGHSTPRFMGFSVIGEYLVGQQVDPSFWRNASYATQNRPLFLADGPVHDLHYGGPYTLWRSDYDPSKYEGGSGGLRWNHRSSTAGAKLNFFGVPQPHFAWSADTLHFINGSSATHNVPATTAYCDLTFINFLRFQSWSFVQLDNDDYSRAIDTRSYSRLLFEKDFLKAPLHVASFVAYEHIGRHDATSDLGSETLGPAHLMHVRVSATIQGVTLYWGVDNLTGQHYYYLPGYPMIAKEEYFGLKWTLTL